MHASAALVETASPCVTETSADPLLAQTGLTREQRILRARIANGTLLARTADRSAMTAAARRAFLSRFADEIDPDRSMRQAIDDACAEGRVKDADRLEDEFTRRVGYARSAHFRRLALASSRARAAKKNKK